MLSDFLQREKTELLQGVRLNAPHTGDIRRAIEGAFNVAAAAAGRRQRIAYDQSYTAAQRKAELASLVDGELLPQLASITAPIRKARAYVVAERAKYHGDYLPPAVTDLNDDIGRVETAVYFARRELDSASNMDAAEIHAMLNAENAR